MGGREGRGERRRRESDDGWERVEGGEKEGEVMGERGGRGER